MFSVTLPRPKPTLPAMWTSRARPRSSSPSWRSRPRRRPPPLTCPPTTPAALLHRLERAFTTRDQADYLSLWTFPDPETMPRRSSSRATVLRPKTAVDPGSARRAFRRSGPECQPLDLLLDRAARPGRAVPLRHRGRRRSRVWISRGAGTRARSMASSTSSSIAPTASPCVIQLHQAPRSSCHRHRSVPRPSRSSERGALPPAPRG